MHLIKEKPLFPLPHPPIIPEKSVSSQMHLRDDCSQVINEIKHKGSIQPHENSGKSRCHSNNQGKVASQTRKYGF
jgi:hypothetical protein